MDFYLIFIYDSNKWVSLVRLVKYFLIWKLTNLTEAFVPSNDSGNLKLFTFFYDILIKLRTSSSNT